MSAVPPSLKVLLSVVKRAEELEKSASRVERIVAYHCRLYAVTKAMKLASKPTAEENKFITEQINKLEALKPSLNLANDEGRRVCREHADSIFSRADDIDRSGLADKAIAKLFYAAGTFYDILEQFGELDSEVLEKKKYAKWKATEIVNAVNAGERPIPGGFGDAPVPDDNDAHSASAPAAVAGYAPASLSEPTVDAMSIPSPPLRQPSTRGSVPLIYPGMPAPTAPAAHAVSHAATMQPIYPTAASSSATSAAGPAAGFQAPRAAPLNNSDPRVKDAVELCNFAMTALKHNEIALARERLQEALRRLG